MKIIYLMVIFFILTFILTSFQESELNRCIKANNYDVDTKNDFMQKHSKYIDKMSKLFENGKPPLMKESIVVHEYLISLNQLEKDVRDCARREIDQKNYYYSPLDYVDIGLKKSKIESCSKYLESNERVIKICIQQIVKNYLELN